ncbi:18231_t:CDS:2 [Racocetra persica]|uniref:18231_t:CDS:1 n=1 Tax=Racocetra persica TaxID=160502 RepID=A0ACA9MA91_9GLOM|nr:18231_t:CDS:2 [Racocetra persica]
MDKFIIRQSSKTSDQSNMNDNKSSESDQKKKIHTTWNPNLSKVYPWLEKSEDNDGVVIVFCTWCKVAKKSNQFTESIQSLRKQTFEHHLITVDHQKATIFQDNQQTTIIQRFTQQLNDQKLKIISLIRNVYYLSKSNQNILIDKSTSFTAKHLAIVTKYLTQNTPVLRYLGMIELDNCNAESITNNLERFIIAKSLNIENPTHFGSDRASTILGQCTGIAAHLKKYNPYITENHCIAHRLHLASQDIAKQVAYFKTYDTIVKGIYLYFSSSYKRALLEEAANNQQAASLLANINQEFEIVLPTYGSNLLEYIANNNLNIYELPIFIFDFAQATIECLNNRFPNQELYNALGIFDLEQLPKLDSDLANYSNKNIKILSNFYRTSKMINSKEFKPLINNRVLISEWEIVKFFLKNYRSIKLLMHGILFF